MSVCDQQGLDVLAKARTRGIGTIAKRPLAGRPWAHETEPTDPVHAEYHRRFDALRFAAHAPGVDCVIVGGTDVGHLARNAAAVASGPPDAALQAGVREAFGVAGPHWRGLV